MRFTRIYTIVLQMTIDRTKESRMKFYLLDGFGVTAQSTQALE